MATSSILKDFYVKDSEAFENLKAEINQVTKCPKCRSTHIEEHGTKPGDFHWWLCRDCGWSTPAPCACGIRGGDE